MTCSKCNRKWYKVTVTYEVEIPEEYEDNLLQALEVFSEEDEGLHLDNFGDEEKWARGFKLEKIDSENPDKLEKVDSEIPQLD